MSQNENGPEAVSSGAVALIREDRGRIWTLRAVIMAPLRRTLQASTQHRTHRESTGQKRGRMDKSATELTPTTRRTVGSPIDGTRIQGTSVPHQRGKGPELCLALGLAVALAIGDHDDTPSSSGCYVELCSYESQRDHELARELRATTEAIRELREQPAGTHHHENTYSRPNRCEGAGERPCDNLNHSPREGD